MQLSPDPLVVIVRNRRTVQGMDHLGEPVPRHDPMPLSEALARRWKCYAHLTLYTVPTEDRWPRLNKPVLPALRARGVELEVSITALDYDNDNHEKLDLAGYNAFVAKVRSFPPSVPQPTLIFKTRSGARALYVHPATTPEKAEVFHRALVHLYMQQGVPMDHRCYPWNWLHALPYVTRDGTPLDPEPLSWGKSLKALPTLPDPPPALKLRPLANPMPDLAEAEALVWTDRGKLTPWGKAAKARMVGRDAYPCFDKEQAPEVTTERNPTFFKWGGGLVGMLKNYVPDTTPEHIFGVLCPSVVASLRNGDRDLLAEVWKGVKYCWAHEEAKAEQEAEASADFLEELRARLEWADAPGDRDEFAAWCRRRLAVVVGTDCYVLTASGRYSPFPVKPLALVSQLRESGLVGPGRVLPDMTTMTKKGPVPLSGQAILDRYATTAAKVEYRPLGVVGGVLRERPSGNVLEVSAFCRRSDLVPTHSPFVQEWLQHVALSEPEVTGVLERWIAAALAVERGPTAALSIQGPGGIGKDMLATALANCFTSRVVATGSIFGQFQYAVNETPVVFVNEAWPEGLKGIDKRLRDMVGGASFEVNQKHTHHQKSYTMLRVLLTGNTDAVVRALFNRRGMSEDERRAILQRVIHLDVSFHPAEEHPARKFFEAHPSKLWQPDLVDEFSRHFLWLHQQLDPKLQGRFLMVGDENDPVMAAMAFGDDDKAEVGELLLGYYEAGRIKDDLKVTAGELMDYALSLIGDPRWKRFNVVSLGRILSHFRVPGTRRLDLDKLLQFATAAELKAKRLKAAVKVGVT